MLHVASQHLAFLKLYNTYCAWAPARCRKKYASTAKPRVQQPAQSSNVRAQVQTHRLSAVFQQLNSELPQVGYPARMESARHWVVTGTGRSTFQVAESELCQTWILPSLESASYSRTLIAINALPWHFRKRTPKQLQHSFFNSCYDSRRFVLLWKIGCPEITATNW